MEVSRLNHKVFKWAYMQGNSRYKNWCIRVKQHFSKSGFENYFWNVGVGHISKAFIKQQMKNTVFDGFKLNGDSPIWRQTTRCGVREEISSEHTGYFNRAMEKNSIFLVYDLSFNIVHAKFRCGVAPLRIETRR